MGSATWKPGIAFHVYIVNVELQNVLRDGALVLIAIESLLLTRDEHRAANGFSWEPIREVAILFAGIFVAIAPVMAMLQAGSAGAFAFLLRAVTAHDGTRTRRLIFGSLAFCPHSSIIRRPTSFSSSLPAAIQKLMGPLAGTLASISMGAVYMGALTYIGNAPNLIVRSIAQERGISMPNFFAYMLWAGLVLIPLFALLTLLPISPLLKLR